MVTSFNAKLLSLLHYCSFLNVQRNSRLWCKFVGKEEKEKILTCLFCLDSDVSWHFIVLFNQFVFSSF